MEYEKGSGEDAIVRGPVLIKAPEESGGEEDTN